MIFLDFSCFKSTHSVLIHPLFNFHFHLLLLLLVSFDIFVFHLEMCILLSTMYLFPSRTCSSYISFVFSLI